MTRVKYVESSYNDAESKALEKVYSDSLGQYLTASVKIYDKIENQNVKYISIIYRLKENYLENPTDADDLRVLTLYQLYHIFPKNTFTGEAQYVYQSSGSMQSSSIPIGTPIKRSTD